jgi:hypothetical protein
MLRIHVNDPTLLGELREALGDADCSTAELSEDTLLVTHPLADEYAARVELEFFLRAWQTARPGAVVELLS